jgi:hypothetical protein
MYGKIKDHLIQEIKDIREAGLYKDERILSALNRQKSNWIRGKKC